MARFPSREADVAALAGNVIVGLTESADDFPAPPVPAAFLLFAQHNDDLGVEVTKWNRPYTHWG